MENGLLSNPPHRLALIRDFEDEYKIAVPPDVEWGPQDMFIRLNGSLYYHKLRLQEIHQWDVEDMQQDVDNTKRQAALATLNAFLGFERNLDMTSPDHVKAVIKEAPAGLPRFIAHNKKFYQFEDVCQNKIEADNLTRPLLDSIEQSFTGLYNPYLCDVSEGLYQKDGKVYLTDITKWTYNPTCKIGVFMNPPSSAVYTDMESTSLFFPFREPSYDDIKIINALNDAETDNKDVVQIILL